MSRGSRIERTAFMLALIIAGEAVFSLPFHVARFFRPTVLRVFELTNTELGAAQAVYGVVAMLAYFPGGLLADRFSARSLLTVSLLTTSAGGLYFATFPPYDALGALFGFWGVTTILLFWAALIRATREWGGADEQGRAFGVLDGGRGLVAAVMAAAAVAVFQSLLPADPSAATPAERTAALRGIIHTYTAVTAAAGALCWLAVPERRPVHPAGIGPLEHVGSVARMPRVWLQALIVVCAYIGYKGVDDYALYAVQAYGMNEVEGAEVAALSAWVRPFAAVGAGWLADRTRASLVTSACFAVLMGSYAWLALAAPQPSARWVLFLNVLVSCVAIFGLRGVYFALFQEADVPLAATGTAVGLVSVIGYTPDIFVNLIAGVLLDRAPGVAGHQHFFAFLGVSAAVGFLASSGFGRISRNLMHSTFFLLVCGVFLSTGCATRGAADVSSAGRLCLLDLTYPYDEDTVYWPTAPSKFDMQTLSYGHTEGGFFYSAYQIATPEHGGTHIDAPVHFAEGQDTTEAIPLERLIAPGVVIDMSTDAARDSDALLGKRHVDAFERDHGAITPGTIVLVHTGWGRYWPDTKRYLGDDTPGDTSNLHFPGISAEAARVLVARGVAAVGIDTASIDHGPSKQFIAHRVLMEAGIPGFENVANLEEVPPRGAEVIALPMKIACGSGGPLRIVATLSSAMCTPVRAQ